MILPEKAKKEEFTPEQLEQQKRLYQKVCKIWEINEVRNIYEKRLTRYTNVMERSS